MFDKHSVVAVGVGDDASTEAAIRYAAWLAQLCNVDLRLVHVVPQTVRRGGPYASAADQREQRSRELLSQGRLLAETVLAPDRVHEALLHGSRPTALMKEAQDARVLVLGSDTRAPLERLAAGATVTEVSADSHVPVVVVPAGWHRAASELLLAVAVRDIGPAGGLLERAFALAEEWHARVRVVHASGLPNPDPDPLRPGIHADPPSMHVSEQLRVVVAGVAERHPDVAHEVTVAHGDALSVLTAVSASSDLLVLERRDRWPHTAHLGRTARALLRESRCPVLVLPRALETSAASADDPSRARASARVPVSKGS